jgi:hypothetical protein
MMVLDLSELAPDVVLQIATDKLASNPVAQVTKAMNDPTPHGQYQNEGITYPPRLLLTPHTSGTQ